MRRPLALFTAALVLAAGAARADTFDVDLSRLGAPSASVWNRLAEENGFAVAAPFTAEQLAGDARRRFAILVSELGLTLTSLSLQTAATTGLAGFAVELETGHAQVHSRAVGTLPPGVTGVETDPWPTRERRTKTLVPFAIHVRKGFPYSLELGARSILIYASQMVAGQLEAKWALHEGFRWHPEVAVRGAVTHLFNQRDLDLTAADLDLILSKRFALGGVATVSPYFAFRNTWIRAGTGLIDFGPARAATPPPGRPADPAADLLSTQAAFPDFSLSDHRFTRFTLGARATTLALSLGLEATYFDGRRFGGGGGYPVVRVPASWSGALQAGLAF